VVNSGWTADPADLTIPPDASGATPRIHISPGDLDPILESIGQDNGIVFYISEDAAFVISVEGGVPGTLRFWATNATQLHQIFEASYFPDAATPQVNLDFFPDSQDPAELHQVSIAPDYLDLGPGSQPLDTDPDGDVTLYLRSMARGLVNHVESNAASAAVGAETVVLTLPSFRYRANRFYEARLDGGVFGSAATNLANWHLRKTNVAGQDLGEYLRNETSGGANVMGVHGSVYFTLGNSDVTAQLVLPLSSSAGTATQYGNANTPRSVKIFDLGAATDGTYTAYPQLV